MGDTLRPANFSPRDDGASGNRAKAKHRAG